MSRTPAVRNLLAVLIVLTAGSVVGAGFFLKGARKAEADPTDVVQKYDVESCVMIADGSSAGEIAADYWLFEDEDGLALFERSGPADGAIILNRWTEDDGDHFFVWVKTSHAWEYILPEDRKDDGLRLVYPKGTYRKDKDDLDVTRPVGEPTAQCILTPMEGE